jgi:hypothetical protein
MAQDAPSTLTWNNGTSNWYDLPSPMDNCGGAVNTTGCTSGAIYTVYLASFTGMASPYNAAKYCADLAPPDPRALGRADWYLPDHDALDVMYISFGPAPARGFQSSYYWSSSEYDIDTAWVQLFSSGGQSSSTSSTNSSTCVVCVPEFSSEMLNHLII